MTVAVKQPQPCHYVFTIQLGAQAIKPVREAVLQEVAREATIAGFRKGKAPLDLVRQQHGKAIEDETLHRATRSALEQAAKAHALKPVGPFEVTAAAFTEEGGLRLEATVEVEPAFALAACKGIPLTKLPAEVSAAEVEQALTKLRESMAQLVPAKTGEGKERRVPALDDELAKDLGYESLAKLRAHVEAKLCKQKRTSQADALEAALCDELLKRHPFEVPPRLVGHQTERLTREFKA
ncbi:MAG TPA: trigger factor, partial [archaeon]|nr:trigger factor [archaeon]